MYLRDTGTRVTGRRLNSLGYSYALCDLKGNKLKKVYVVGKTHEIENLQYGRNYRVMLEEVEKIPLIEQDMNLRIGRGYRKTRLITRQYTLRVVDDGSGYYTQPYECWEIIR